MLDTSDFLFSIKKAAKEAVDAGQPSDFCFGRVISETPLKISVEQKMVLSTAQLILTRNVTDYHIEMSVNHTTDIALDINMQHTHGFNGNAETYSGQTNSAGTNEPHMHEYSHSHILSGNVEYANNVSLGHRHDYSGRKTFLIHNSLKLGEDVVLLKQKGGQKFLVIDRVMNI